MMLSACGSGYNSGSSAVLQGQFKDSHVEGVHYATETLSGTTDANGTFEYREGEIVTFSLGGVTLGKANGVALVTPIDLVPGARDENDPAVTNIARLLQALDQDGDPANGIRIPPQVRAAMEQVRLDFSTPAFGNSAAVVALMKNLNDARAFGQERRLVSTEQARAHLRFSLGGEPPQPLPQSATTIQVIADSPTYHLYQHGLSLAFDAQDQPHLISGGDHLYHHFRDAEGWHTESLDVAGIAPGPNGGARLSIDVHGHFHLISFDTGSALIYATNRSGHWSAETLQAAAAAVDGNGDLHTLVYDSLTRRFTYGRLVGERWLATDFQAEPGAGNSELAGAAPAYMSLEVDAWGKAHLVYSKTAGQYLEDTAIYYASNAQGSWRTEQLHEDYSIVPTSLALAVDERGVPQVAYGYREVIHGTMWCMPWPCDNRDQVEHFTRVDGSWTTSMADGLDSPDDITISMGRNGSVDLLVNHYDNLSLLSRTGDSWSILRPPEPLRNISAYSSARDSSGRLHVGFLAEGGLRHALLSDGAWQFEDVAQAKPVGEFPDMARDAAGVLHVGFWDKSGRVVKHASNAGGAWAIETVAQGVTLKKPLSIAVTAGGDVVMAYVDTGSNKLKYARKSALGWSVQTIPAEYVVNRASLSLDGDGKAHIVYMDFTLWEWMYANDSSGTWSVSPLARARFDDPPPDIAISANGMAHVCLEMPTYSSNTLAPGLWLAQKARNATTWTFEAIHSGAMDGSDCSVLVDDGGRVHLSYRRDDVAITYQDSWELVYARSGASGWDSQVIARGLIGKLSMTLNAQGKAFISFYDAANGVVDYATNAGAGWATKLLTDLNTYDEPEFLAPLSVGSSGQLNAALYDAYAGDLKLITLSDPLQ